MKDEKEKKKNEKNPFLEKFGTTVSSRFDKASKALKDYNKKLDYGFNVVKKNS